MSVISLKLIKISYKFLYEMSKAFYIIIKKDSFKYNPSYFLQRFNNKWWISKSILSKIKEINI